MRKINQKILNKIINEELKYFIKKQKLNEGILDVVSSIFGSSADAITDRIKEQIGIFVLRALNVNTDGFLGKILINVFENLEISEVFALVTGREDRCKIIARELIEAVGETIIEKIPEHFGIGQDSFIFPILREMITNNIVRNNQMIDRLANTLCNLQMSNILSNSGINRSQASSLMNLENLFGASTN